MVTYEIPAVGALVIDAISRKRRGLMQALILAAGYGARLHNASAGSPKGLLTIGGRPILDRQIEMLHSFGISDICIVTGYKAILFESRYKANVCYRFNPFFNCSNNIISFMFARDWMMSDLVVLYADLIYEDKILEASIACPAAIGLSVDRATVAPGHALVTLQDNWVRNIDKALDPADADARFVGIAKFSRQGVADLLPEIERAARYGMIDQYYTIAIQSLLTQGYRVAPIDVTGRRWMEIDDPQDLARARLEWD
jgi:choline kinase